MNEPQQQPQRKLNAEGKRAVLTGLLSFFALPVQIFIRKKTGFRLLKPSHLIGLTLVLLAFNYLVGTPAGSAAKGFLTGPETASVSPESGNAPGFDAPWPQGLTAQQLSVWQDKHRLTPQQQQEQAKRLEEEAQARAESVARWAKIHAFFADWPMKAFAVLFLAWGLVQRRQRWDDILGGVKWHTKSRGVPYISAPLKGFLAETYILRFADPLVVAVAGVVVYAFSEPLGAWLVFSAFSLFIVEQYVYDDQLEGDLDMLDNLIDAESASDTLRHWKKGSGGQSKAAATIEQNGGVLSTSATIPDLVARREKREGRNLHTSFGEASPFAEAGRVRDANTSRQQVSANGISSGDDQL